MEMGLAIIACDYTELKVSEAPDNVPENVFYIIARGTARR